jgi:hypothetical protein
LSYKKKDKPDIATYSGTVSTGAALSVAINSLLETEAMLASVVHYGGKEFLSLEPILSNIKDANKKIGEEIHTFISKNKDKLDAYHTKIEAYRNLINKGAAEPDFQKFFEENPVFFHTRKMETFPKKSFAGENFPDFVLVLDDGSCILVEIEAPRMKLYTKKGDPTAELGHAEEQIREYLRFAKEEKDFLRKRGLKKLTVENVTGLVVIGSSLSQEEKSKLDVLNSMVRGNYEVKTFDRILEENEWTLANMREMTE